MKIVVPHGCWPYVHAALAGDPLPQRVSYAWLAAFISMGSRPAVHQGREHLPEIPHPSRQLLPGAGAQPASASGVGSRGFTDEALQNTLYDNAFARLLGEK